MITEQDAQKLHEWSLAEILKALIGSGMIKIKPEKNQQNVICFSGTLNKKAKMQLTEAWKSATESLMTERDFDDEGRRRDVS